MNLENYKNKKVSLFGKPRAFDVDTLAGVLQRYGITLTEGFDEESTLVIEGAVMPTPLQLKAEELYESGSVEFVDIDDFEREAARHIDPKKLLMSLKLTNDQTRLVAYLQNDHIDNTLFLQLLKLYDFNSENFFENDTNRDVSAALIRRFYDEYEKNHNIQYSNVGLVNMIEHSSDPLLLETLFALQPTQKALSDTTDPNAKLIQMMAMHPSSTPAMLARIIDSAQKEYILYVASRDYLDTKLQSALLTLDDKEIDELLAASKELERTTVETLLQRGLGQRLAQNLTLTEELFTLLKEFPSIGANTSLTSKMQQELFKSSPEYLPYLAQNSACTLTEELLALEDAHITSLVMRHHDITSLEKLPEGFEADAAQNEHTPKELLAALFERNEQSINEKLASNPATPIDILYQLSFDPRYAHSVKQNPSFGEHIKTTHAIGIFE